MQGATGVGGGTIEQDPTGIEGLDYVLRGGLPRGHSYLVEGSAGAGKTTLGLQFLLEGVRRGEKTLWCTLSETEEQLRETASSHGWSLDGITIANLTRSEAAADLPDASYSFFSPADIELGDIARAIVELTERERPRRIVFDPFSDVRLLANDPLRYRRQVLQLREHFARIGATVLLIQERNESAGAGDPAAEAVVHGIIALTQETPDYGRPRRRLRVHKLRAVNYWEGFHDVRMLTGGLAVYPRLVAAEHEAPSRISEISSGSPELDQMMGGGFDRGTSFLVMGPAGAGKSTLCTQFVLAAAARGERSVMYLFDETERALHLRAHRLGQPIAERIRDGLVHVRQIDPAEISPGEFAHDVRTEVERDGARLVVIDSLNGYLTGMPDERHLSLHLHELLTYLAYRNVFTILTLNQHGLVGDASSAPIEISYLADAGLLLRYFESDGAVRRAASVVKRRTGPHEVSIRELTIAPPAGVRFGKRLQEFRGVLTGYPDYIGGAGDLETPRPS